MKHILFFLLISLIPFTGNAYLLDFYAISDDDTISDYGGNSVSYTTGGYYKLHNEGNKIKVQHDSHEGIYQGETDNFNGISIKGVDPMLLDELEKGDRLERRMNRD
ncbi:MAG: hypothetical protein ACI4NE_08245 [Succinivibrio sp.]